MFHVPTRSSLARPRVSTVGGGEASFFSGETDEEKRKYLVPHSLSLFVLWRTKFVRVTRKGDLIPIIHPRILTAHLKFETSSFSVPERASWSNFQGGTVT